MLLKTNAQISLHPLPTPLHLVWPRWRCYIQFHDNHCRLLHMWTRVSDKSTVSYYKGSLTQLCICTVQIWVTPLVRESVITGAKAPFFISQPQLHGSYRHWPELFHIITWRWTRRLWMKAALSVWGSRSGCNVLVDVAAYSIYLIYLK